MSGNRIRLSVILLILASLVILPHLASRYVVNVLLLDTCSPNFLIQEFNTTGLHAEILKKPIRFEKGYIIPPTEPGLGVELNEDVVAEHPYKPS